MSWYKIVISKEQGAAELDIQERFHKALIACGGHPDLKIYMERRTVNEFIFPFVFFLPPFTAAYCSDIIEDYSGQPCETPDISTIVVHFGVR